MLSFTKPILCALLLFTAVASSQDLPDLFESWKLKHNKDYLSVEENQMRFEIFSQNFAVIQEWNSKGDTAILGLNIFADLKNSRLSMSPL